MGKIIGALLFFVALQASAQSKNHYVSKGYAIAGYDVVAYFDGDAVEGDKAYETVYGGVKFKFVSQKNLEKFKTDTKRYLPKYGGYCAYAVAVAGKKVSINPETFEIRDGELYLFYNFGNTNTLESWLSESPDNLKIKADANWTKIVGK